MDYAKESRANPTTPENRLWNCLRARQLGGFKFRQQHKLVDARPDFFCPAVGLAVEVDGHTHDAEDDAIQDANLLALGSTTVRFSNTDVMQNLEGFARESWRRRSRCRHGSMGAGGYGSSAGR